jgi:CRP-like cAMP-binding protein
MAIVHHPRIDARLTMLFWHLADRWGVMGADGVTVPITGLTHSILADLVAAQRPTVSAALGALERKGAIVRVSGGYRLHGSPPVEMGTIVANSPRQAGVPS